MAPGIIAVDVRHRSTLMKSDWFGTAIGNSGFMHSLLATIALHAWVFGKDTIDAVLYHRAQAIAAVNAAILTPDGVSDANIGAVFNLLTIEQGLRLPCFELHEDHAAQLEIHERGLQRMVQLRGGLRAINTNRILQAFMLWCVAKTPTFCPEPGWHVLTEHQAFDRSRHLQLPTTKPLYIGFHQHVRFPTSSSRLPAEHLTASNRLLPACWYQRVAQCPGGIGALPDSRSQRLVQ